MNRILQARFGCRFIWSGNVLSYTLYSYGLHKNTQVSWVFNYIVKRNVYLVELRCIINTLRPRQNGRHFADDTFKRIFVNENAGISIKISLKFGPKGPINNTPALVQVMALRRPGDQPLTEPMVVRLLKHICVTRPQCVKGLSMEILSFRGNRMAARQIWGRYGTIENTKWCHIIGKWNSISYNLVVKSQKHNSYNYSDCAFLIAFLHTVQ